MAPRAAIWQCPHCELQFSSRVQVRKHITQEHPQDQRINGRPRLPRLCPVCHQLFYSASALFAHVQRSGHWAHLTHACGYCHQRFASVQEVSDHTTQAHFTNYYVVEKAFNRRLETVERVLDTTYGADADSIDQECYNSSNEN